MNWRRNTPFLFRKEKRQQKTETIQKNVVFFEMTGKYVKGEDKEGTKKG